MIPVAAPAPRIQFLLAAFLFPLLFLLSSLPSSSARLNPDWSSPSRWKANPKLDYYVHTDLGDLDVGRFLPAIHPDLAVDFGSTHVFSFNATVGAERQSTRVGFFQGYLVQSSYLATVRGMEADSLNYDDGSMRGTVQLRGLIAGGGSKIAIVGGTNDFRGVRGYGNVTQISSTGNTVVYRHQLNFV